MNQRVRDLQHFVELYESGREFCYKNVGKANAADWPIAQLLEHITDARLYVSPITVTIEIPKPMSDYPAVGQEYFYLAPSTTSRGWGQSKWRGHVDFSEIIRREEEERRFKNGIWRSKEEVEQVVAAIRGTR